MKWFVIAGLIFVGGLVAAYFQGVVGLETVFSHLYYVPILYAVYCWQWRGLWVAGLLGLTLVFSHLLFLGELPVAADIFRAILFVLIGSTFAFALDQLRRENASLSDYGQVLARRLEFIFDFSNTCSQAGKSPGQICKELIAAWPKAVGGLIKLDGVEYPTDNYRETPWHLQAPIMVRNREAGWVKLDYLERPDENRHRHAFLRDTQLLTIITKEMSAYIERLDLGRELLKISESEQVKIGRDLHDGLAQVLTGISLMFEVLSMDSGQMNQNAQKLFRQIGEMLEEAIIQTRLISYGLCPVDMKAGGLYRSLRELSEKTRTIRSVECEFVCEDPDLVKDSSVAGHLFRIAQEAVGSAINYCKASKIRIELNSQDGQTVMSIWDNGNHTQACQHETYNLGVELMKYRACLIEAELMIEKDSQHGSWVICRIF